MAGRLWLRDEHAYNVHERMFTFYQELAEAVPRGPYDIREHATTCDEQMLDGATFIGLVVCSLDTSTGSWQDVLATASVTTTDTRAVRLWNRPASQHDHPAPKPRIRRVEDFRDIPCAIRIVLTDGTVIVAERRGRPDFDHRIVHSTATLNYSPQRSPYPWGWVSRDQLDEDPAHTEVLRAMSRLSDLCTQADAARLEALRRRSPFRGTHR